MKPGCAAYSLLHGVCRYAGVFCLFLYSVVSGATGVVFPTRVVYQQSTQNNGATVQIDNQSGQNYLLQSRVIPYGQKEGAALAAPFIVLPPLTRLSAGKQVVVLLRRTGGQLPTNRESVFWLSLKLIPSQPAGQAKAMVFRLVTQYRLKLFYRPKAIEDPQGIAKALQGLTVRQEGAVLIVHNPSPYYLTLSRLQLGKQKVPLMQLMQMVPPMGEQRYRLPSPTEQKQVSIQAFDETGRGTVVRQLVVS